MPAERAPLPPLPVEGNRQLHAFTLAEERTHQLWPNRNRQGRAAQAKGEGKADANQQRGGGKPPPPQGPPPRWTVDDGLPPPPGPPPGGQGGGMQQPLQPPPLPSPQRLEERDRLDSHRVVYTNDGVIGAGGPPLHWSMGDGGEEEGRVKREDAAAHRRARAEAVRKKKEDRQSFALQYAESFRTREEKRRLGREKNPPGENWRRHEAYRQRGRLEAGIAAGGAGAAGGGEEEALAAAVCGVGCIPLRWMEETPPCLLPGCLLPALMDPEEALRAFAESVGMPVDAMWEDVERGDGGEIVEIEWYYGLEGTLPVGDMHMPYLWNLDLMSNRELRGEARGVCVTVVKFIDRFCE